MPTLHVPFHQDERLADGHLPVPEGAQTLEPVLPDGTVWNRLTALHSAVADRVAAEVSAGAIPTVVSGDCLVALGTVAGVQRAGIDAGVVWFDAHGDVHTLETTTSGYLGGLSLRLLLGAHADLVAVPLGLRPLTTDQALLVDARDLDPAEATYLATDGPARVVVDAVARPRMPDTALPLAGPRTLAAGAAPARPWRPGADAADLPDGPLVLHVDVDVIDAAELPGLLFPAPHGPSTEAVLAAVRRVMATGRVVALDVACPWHPAASDQDAAIRADLIANLAS
ncbi:arginase [Asanoa hainanensis]|uniref:Arginase n=1 Tax=Asanoa hainanensis TaxID=560556 RepID=A0A239G6L6_9ACTN|nr:arginase family protein [Asanoa hainanensis]SNS64418.1 arginase [Asanoa hainanensis]